MIVPGVDKKKYCKGISSKALSIFSTISVDGGIRYIIIILWRGIATFHLTFDCLKK